MMKSDSLIHRFPDDTCLDSLPLKFTFPFCYTPSEVTKAAAGFLMEEITSDDELSDIFSAGKMLGVLIVTDSDGRPGFLAGFSGLAGGRNIIPGFVPPILDLLDPDGTFKKEEKEISRINLQIREILESEELAEARTGLATAVEDKEKTLTGLKLKIKESKSVRKAIRERTADEATIASLARESQYEKADFKRISTSLENKKKDAERRLDSIISKVNVLKKERAKRSDALQKWIFENCVVENALGERKNILEIFADKGIVPPGGTGECAAPKLLHSAYCHGLKPVSMGEFWYCTSISGTEKSGIECNNKEVRLHGRFYPSCTGKCGPLLGFMLKGLDIEENPLEKAEEESIRIIYEDDDLLAIDKPSGMLSVPGRTGGISAIEILKKQGYNALCIHRLDMETSGVLIFAKNEVARKKLQNQFAERSVEKEYIAILDMAGYGPDNTANPKTLKSDCKSGVISLPIGSDYNDRPRQIVDTVNGKEAITEYEVLSYGEGWVKIKFRPLTGRTHQLRVHSAHPSGLGFPIKGDRLYGGCRGKDSERLFLHAQSVTFTHPSSGKKLKIKALPDF